MTHALTLRLEGSFEALGPADMPIEGLSKRGQALLAYLACQPGMVASRVVLMELLWSERSREQASASLRQELSRLRRILPEAVLAADRSDVRLQLDTLRILPGQGAPLLDGFDLASRGFEDWLRDERARRLDRARENWLAEASAALEAGDGKTAQDAALTALDVDPASELAMQVLLRAALRGGDRPGALARLKRFETYLAEELDLSPLPETCALAEDLRQGAPAVAAPPVAPELCATGKDGRPVLAILPFDEIGSDPNDMFADGVVEEITASLSRSCDFHVIARQSSFALRGQDVPAEEAGARLGADYLLEGSLQRAGDRVRITTRLVLSRSRHVLWSDRQDERLDNLFDLQDRIAAHVAGQLSPNLRSAEIERARAKAPRDRTAYDLVLTAYPWFWSHRREDNSRALALYDEALACDPDYPLARSMKAWCHAQQGCYLWSTTPDADRDAVEDLVSRTLPMVQDDPNALVALAAAITISKHDYSLSETCLDRALVLDPNNAWGWLRRGWNNVFSGQVEAALAHFDIMERLSPLDPFHFNLLFGRSAALRAAGRYDEAIDLIERGLQEGSGATWAYRMLFGTHFLAGNRAEALAAARKWRETNPQVTPEMMATQLPNWTHDPDYIAALQSICDFV
ncbi:tetratricopeptide repeat protein [Tropicimonas sp. TH_r6]|uniref:tetratricopeptide repeat protein n=1 Tax=Tropicimonas sp. TH_r6 TaxID=3082085 RepID=UPI00295443B0|nr:tetratricopeptide repeat protein [Tropicimonas sp. TH_r6]MDV7142436.1 tetratricopeptide repeat protein [Tropicimonas sp. TH_r6]